MRNDPLAMPHFANLNFFNLRNKTYIIGAQSGTRTRGLDIANVARSQLRQCPL